ncbi:MAG: hypothetical protein LC104_11945 [Bacteroidales bacterium]|nr:hypothetical protein [Bacteroidales bacterium]
MLMSTVARARFLLLAVVGLLIPACTPADSVRSYTVPKATHKTTDPAAQASTPAEAGEYRFLGAMYPAEDPVWFVKFAGPGSALDAQVQAFDEFLASVQFPKGWEGGPEWKLPTGWKDGPTRNAMGIVIRTVHIGSGNPPLELTVSQARGGVQGNVDRWAGQVGAPTGPELLAKYTRSIKTADGRNGVRVDVTGPKNPAATRPPFMGGR